MLNLILLFCIVILLLPISLRKVIFYSLIGTVVIVVAYIIEDAYPFKVDTKEFSLQYVILYLILILGIINLLLFCYRKKKKKEPITPLKKHEIWMDLLKIISAIMIVFIHSSGSIYTNYFEERKIWMEALLVNTIPRFAVPCFFMISGIVLLRKEYTMHQLKKKIIRVIVPLVFWSVLSIFLRKILWKEGNVIRDILLIPFRRADGVMWYAYQLIWVYLSLPILTKIDKTFSYQGKKYFIGITLLLPSAINYMIQLLSLPVELVFSSTNLYLTVQYWGLLFLGKYLYDRYAEQKIKLWKSGLMILIGILWIIGSTYFLSIQKKSPVNCFFEELSLPVLLYSSGVLLLTYSLKEKLEKIAEYKKKAIQEVASVSLGIYFMHCMVMWILYSFTLGGIYFAMDIGIRSMIVCAICYYLISLVISFLMKQIPGIRYLVI